MNSKRVEVVRTATAAAAKKFRTGEWTEEDHTSIIIQTESGLFFQIWGEVDKITKLAEIAGRVEVVFRDKDTLDTIVRPAIIRETTADTERGLAAAILSEGIIEALTPEAVAMGLDYSEIINGIRAKAAEIMSKTECECGPAQALSAVIQQLIRQV